MSAQTIFRSKKSRDFTTFSNSLLRDKSLSYKSRGLLCMVLSNEDDWEVHQSWLCDRGTEGREAIRSAMQELEAHGHVQYDEVREAGKIVSTRWTFHEIAIQESERTNRSRWRQSPDYGKPSLGAPNYGKPEGGLPEGGNPSTKKDYKPEDNQQKDDHLILEPEPPAKKKHKIGHVNGSHPAQATIETFCVGIGLPKLDGELMMMKWDADGWPKNWMDKIRYWKRRGFMPSQQDRARGNGNSRGARPVAPPVYHGPKGWEQWLESRPEYLAKVKGRPFTELPEFMRLECNRDLKAKS